MTATEWQPWALRCETFVRQSAGDVAHDIEHIRRVVANAERLAHSEGANLMIVLPAAWLHDCVSVPKSSPQRAQASILAGAAALTFLASEGYPAATLPGIRHAIEAHSFSAGITPRTREAQVVQDADRLDALGAVGVARCLMLSGAMQRRLYDPAEPFAISRPLDDTANAIDHFYLKLLRLAAGMHTAAGRAEAERRTAFLQAFLDQLATELPPATEISFKF